jgi:hypothetical protein
MSIAYAGNEAPSGAHYNLNIIGVQNPKTAVMTGSQGHVIFVPLSGSTKIMLCESGTDGVCSDVEGFQVLDANGTDGTARFALPNPDPDNIPTDATATTVYSVFARALGSPKLIDGQPPTANMKTCASDPDTIDPATGLPMVICSVVTLELKRSKGQSVFQNVSRELLYLYYDLDANGTVERYNLFNDALQDYFWQYDNKGLKLAQLRFYPCETKIIQDPDDRTKSVIDDSACFAK